METEIAKPRKSFMISYIIALVLGVVLCLIGGAGLIFATEQFIKQYSVIFLVAGFPVTGAGIGWTIYFARLPKAYITFNDGRLRLYNGAECSPAEVDYCTARSGLMNGAIYDCGKLIISVKGKEYKFRFVSGVEGVAAQINALKTQFTAIEEMQRHIAEKNAAQTASDGATDSEESGAADSAKENQG